VKYSPRQSVIVTGVGEAGRGVAVGGMGVAVGWMATTGSRSRSTSVQRMKSRETQPTMLSMVTTWIQSAALLRARGKSASSRSSSSTT